MYIDFLTECICENIIQFLNKKIISFSCKTKLSILYGISKGAYLEKKLVNQKYLLTGWSRQNTISSL